MFYSPQHDDIEHQAINTQVEPIWGTSTIPHTPHLPLRQRTLLTSLALLRDLAGLQGFIKKNTPSPWGESTWCTAEKTMLPTAQSSNITRQSHHKCGLIPTISGPPQDTWIQELEEYYPDQ